MAASRRGWREAVSLSKVLPRPRYAGRTSKVKHCAVALRTCRYATSGCAMTIATAAG